MKIAIEFIILMISGFVVGIIMQFNYYLGIPLVIIWFSILIGLFFRYERFWGSGDIFFKLSVYILANLIGIIISYVILSISKGWVTYGTDAKVVLLIMVLSAIIIIGIIIPVVKKRLLGVNTSFDTFYMPTHIN
jgi:hypothetical protein